MKIENQLFDSGLIIENINIKLRLVTLNDIQNLFNLSSDPGLWEYFTVRLDQKESLEKYIVNLLIEHSNRKIIPFVIIDKKKGDKLVGMSCFGNISFPDSRLEIGWSWIGKEFQGTEININYKHLLLFYAFNILKFFRVEFKTDVLNMKARKGLLKIGAIEEGILRSHTQMHSNRRRDTIYYSILKEEWNIENINYEGNNFYRKSH
jgi:RimJ/RimL family protein N-acetyltransferase